MVKTITITEQAYNTLKGMKQGDESFSDVVNRIGSEKKSIFEFAGLLKGQGQTAEELQEKAKETRRKVSESFRKRHDNLGHVSGN